jgi:predicted MarR family transcription regulator
VTDKKKKKAKRLPSASLDKHWHLATEDSEVGLTELEFSIIRVSAAFERWQSDCLACCHGQSFSGSDTAVLHVIRMHDRPKSISEIGRLLKRDDQSNLQYGIRKLLKAGLIEKAKDGRSKKGVTYRVSELGLAVTDKYVVFRDELLVSLTRTVTDGMDLEAIAKVLNLMSGLYDQASCVAATHRVPVQ